MPRNWQREFFRATEISLAVSVASLGGCVSGSLASNTGPHPVGYRWSDAPEQMVYVGETVQFDFVLQDSSRRFIDPLAVADYCTAIIQGRRVEVEADALGHFRFQYTFDSALPGQEIEVWAAAYRQREQRDFMKIRGQWLQSESPYEQPDRLVGEDSIRFTAYQAAIELNLVRPADDLDPETGVLRIRRTDGSATPVYIDRPHRRGFVISEPVPDGGYHLRYLPAPNEVNPSGSTEFELVIYDVAGQPHYESGTFATP